MQLGKPENSTKFIKESSRIIHEMGNMELFELRQISETTQDEETIQRIKARFQALTVPSCFAHINRSRGKKHGEAQWQQDHWKAMDV